MILSYTILILFIVIKLDVVNIYGISVLDSLFFERRDYARIAQKKKRCEKDPEEYFAVYKNETTLPDIDETKIGEFVAKDCRNSDEMIDKISFLTRYCFSCLVDADSIDTGMFCGTKTDEVVSSCCGVFC